MIHLFLLLNSPNISAQLQLYCCLTHVITDLWPCPLVLPYSSQATHTPQCKGFSREAQIIHHGLHQPRAFSQLKKIWWKLP